MPRHLILALDAPLMAFGGETIDSYGVIRAFPAKSMICGLIANALGFARHEGERLHSLQDRLVMGGRLDEPGTRIRDFQTAKLEANDRGWTTRGRVEDRAGGAGTYQGPHLRYRDYHANACGIVALRLDPADAEPNLDAVAAALNEPARPLFLGRKPCLPSTRLVRGFVETENIHTALCAAPPLLDTHSEMYAQWPAREGPEGQNRHRICDERNWISGLHGGDRPVVEGLIRPSDAEAAT